MSLLCLLVGLLLGGFGVGFTVLNAVATPEERELEYENIINELKDDQLALFIENRELKEELEKARFINETHRELNASLRRELKKKEE